jgi:hypothetical protein
VANLNVNMAAMLVETAAKACGIELAGQILRSEQRQVFETTFRLPRILVVTEFTEVDALAADDVASALFDHVQRSAAELRGHALATLLADKRPMTFNPKLPAWDDLFSYFERMSVSLMERAVQIQKQQEQGR